MKRIALTDGSGGWFDSDTATLFVEASRWDGENCVSVATGSQWDHESLFRTAAGRWILNRWSQRDGVAETYESISSADAAVWLVRNDHVAKLAEDNPVADHVASLEL